MTNENSGIRRRIPPELLQRMADLISDEDRDEMAIPSYLHPNPLLRWMAWRRIDAVAAMFRVTVGRIATDQTALRVMDFGCGTGVLFDEVGAHANELTGVDVVLEPASLLVREWGLENVRLLTPEEAEKETDPASIDVIIAAEVLEHIEPLEGTLHFFRERLKGDGTLLVSVPTENMLYRLGRRIAGFDDHYHESNAATIHGKILENGFRSTRLTKIPTPGPLAIYWVAAYEPA